VIWFWVVVLVVVIGAVAVVAAGRGDAMADVYEDRPDMALERGRRLTAADVRAVRFTTAVRGYRMDEVDAFVARMEAELLAGGQAGDEATTEKPAGDGAEDVDADRRPAGANIDGEYPADEDTKRGDAYTDEAPGHERDEEHAERGDGTGASDRT